MVDNQELEQKGQTTPEKKEEKPKQPSTLEGVVTESWSGVKALTNTALGTGAIAGAGALYGIDGLVTGAAFPLGSRILSKLKGEEFGYNRFRDEAIFGSLWTPISVNSINWVKQIPKAFGLDSIVTNVYGHSVPLTSSLVAGAVTSGLLIPALLGLYYPMEYIIKNKTFRGVGKYLKENYYKGLKQTLPLTIFSGLAVAANYAMPFLAPYLFPAIAVSNVLFKIFASTGEGKREYKRLLYPSTYLPNPFNAVEGISSLAGKVYGSVNSLAYGVGSYIRTLLKSEPKPTPAPSPAPAT